MYLTFIPPPITHMNTLLTGYAGSEMGLSEAEVNFRHSEATAAQLAAPQPRTFCCTDHAFRGSEMGHSEATLEALHQEANVIRVQNIARTKANGICDNCPKKAQIEATARIYGRDADIGNDR